MDGKVVGYSISFLGGVENGSPSGRWDGRLVRNGLVAFIPVGGVVWFGLDGGGTARLFGGARVGFFVWVRLFEGRLWNDLGKGWIVQVVYG